MVPASGMPSFLWISMQAGIGDSLVVQPVGLHFQIEVLFPEDFLKFPRDGHGAGHVFLADEIRDLAAQAAGQGDQVPHDAL